MTTNNLIMKSVRLEVDEGVILARISHREGISEAAILRRFIRDGLSRYRVDEALALYERGEIDMRAAARHAGISMYQMMAELQRRDNAPAEANEKFIDGLQTLAETFGGSVALHETIAEYKAT